MSTSTYVHLGAFIRFKGSFVADQTLTEHKCPKCKVVRQGKFCPECGSPIIPKSNTKTKNLKYLSEIIDHIATSEGLNFFDIIGDEVSNYEYSDNCLFPNYASKLNRSLDTDDMQTFMSDVLCKERDEAIEELRSQCSDLLEFLDKYKVDYEVAHGVTIYAS